MWLNWLLVGVLSANHLVYSYHFEDGDADFYSGTEADWDSMESFSPRAFDDVDDGFVPKVKTLVSATTKARPLKLPDSVRIPGYMLYKDLFAPAKGSRPLPPLVKSILLPERVSPTKPSLSGPKMVEVLCFLDRMHVRVLKSLFTEHNARNILKLGTCSVNNVSKTHYHFMYSLIGCGIQRGEDSDRVTYSNTLFYKPVNTGLIVRELPFTVDIKCSYTKFHRSYKVGFLPHLAGGTLFKGLQTHTTPTLVAMDESWKLLPVGQSFVLGKPICFEAKGASSKKGNRLYLNRCFVTSARNTLLRDKYYVVENHGCLVDSKHHPLTKFYTSPDKMTLRLCVAAFLFKNMVSQPPSKKTLFMHCELDFGPETPTPSAKSCMYNTQTQKWTELYGDSSVCNCCASTCPASPRMSGKATFTSESWDLKIGKATSSLLSPEETMPEFPVDDHDFELFWESDD